jgi:methylenetetrahydrofolate--tRNA-(uracil-5-)-methyltransferase
MPPSFGLMPELPSRVREKRARYGAYRDRALADLAAWAQPVAATVAAVAAAC